MKKKIWIIILCLGLSFIIMSGGYGLWQEKLVIIGNIVVEPEPEETITLQEDNQNMNGSGGQEGDSSGGAGSTTE
ncbi:MAG: hypothetical protein ACOYVK_16785 [Bacillota bacterium]